MKKPISLFMSALAIVAVMALVFTPMGCPKAEVPLGPLGVYASGITQTATTITWSTDVEASSQVEYGKTTDYGETTTLDETLVTSHSATLSGLSPGTTYHFRVKSVDAAENLIQSADYTFALLPVKSLNVGLCVPLSGAHAGHQDPAMWGVRLLVEEINDGRQDLRVEVHPEGGIIIGGEIYQVNAVIEDGGYDPEPSYAAITKLYYNYGCLVTWGPVGSSGTLASFSITEVNGMLFMGISTAEACLSYQGEPVKFFFRFAIAGKDKVPVVYDLVHAASVDPGPAITKVAICHWDDIAGHDAVDYVQTECAKYGWEVYDTGPLDHAAITYATTINAILASGADALDVGPAYDTDNGMILKQLAVADTEDQIKWIFRSVGASRPENLIPNLGSPADAEGFVQTHHWEEGWPTVEELGVTIAPWLDDIVTRAEAYYPACTDYKGSFGMIAGYLHMEAMLKAMQEVGSTEQSYENALAVAAALEELTIESFSGQLAWGGLVTYGCNHDLDYPIWLGKFHDDGTEFGTMEYFGFDLSHVP